MDFGSAKQPNATALMLAEMSCLEEAHQALVGIPSDKPHYLTTREEYFGNYQIREMAIRQVFRRRRW
jgi:hypothetical protein